jgi:GNAT superfamily N-acetyltransferase
MKQKREVTITGYIPGAIGRIIELNAAYFNKNYGFNKSFEIEIAKFCSTFFEEYQTNRDGLWIATVNDLIIGSILVDGRKRDLEGAQIRLLIVDQNYQGQGVGTKLLQCAIEFCRKHNHNRVFLWTFKDFKIAKQLYEKNDFTFQEERKVNYWNCVLIEQKYQLDLIK